MTALVRANLGLLGLLVAHSVDHLVRHPSGRQQISSQQWVAAGILYASNATAIALAAKGHHRAPAASAATGLLTFAGPLLAHAAPHWGAFSQSYRGRDADALSWALLLGLVAGGAGVGIAGMRRMDAQAGTDPGESTAPMDALFEIEGEAVAVEGQGERVRDEARSTEEARVDA